MDIEAAILGKFVRKCADGCSDLDVDMNCGVRCLMQSLKLWRNQSQNDAYIFNLPSTR
jgi:hypothetical protein